MKQSTSTLADLNPAQCYATLQARDPRFDGLFYVAVTSTRVYCRPICRVRLPQFKNCRFFRHPAAAEQAGYRPCLKCRPELAPGHSKMDAVNQLARQAAERIQAGALSESSLEALAARLTISSRQLRRAVTREYGVSPVRLALSHRLLLAKQLLTDTELKIIDVAFASGFSSVRRFNDAFKHHYRLHPSDLRHRTAGGTSSQGIVLQLGYRPPLAWPNLIAFLASRGSPGMERVVGDSYYCNLMVGGVAGWIKATDVPSEARLRVEVSMSLLPQLTSLRGQLRKLFDLDATPDAIAAQLGQDPLLKPLLKATPGMRVPGAIHGFELALRAVLGQQVSVRAASTLFGRFVEAFGHSVDSPLEGLQYTAPDPARVADASLPQLMGFGLPQRRASTIKQLAEATACGALDWQRENSAIAQQLTTIPGIGPWTVNYVAMRAFAEPNAFPATDFGLQKALALKNTRAVLTRAAAWQPWRAYAAMYLWQHLSQ